MGKEKKRVLHGEGHGSAMTPEYRSWRSMRSRCYNENSKDYSNYGGVGIRVCKRWSDYRLFLLDMGRRPSPSHTLDRKNVMGHYSPTNCRWATHTEQQRNKRNTMYIAYQGKRWSVSDLGEQAVCGVNLFRSRIQQGWSVQRALSAPAQSEWVRVKIGTKFPNRRGTPKLEYKGESWTLSELAARYGVNKRTLHWRLQQGWSMEKALGFR